MYKQNGRILKRMRDERRKGEARFPIKVLALMVVLLMVGVRLVSASPCSKELRERIEVTLDATHRNIKDMNGDYIVNCVDWAMTFKSEWGKRYPAALCRLVYNHNKSTGWAHMLVRVKYTQDDYYWTHVEPQGNAEVWDPATFWGDDYSPYWNSDSLNSVSPWLK